MFITEWGYDALGSGVRSGTALQTTIDGNGASWTAWVTDNALDAQHVRRQPA